MNIPLKQTMDKRHNTKPLGKSQDKPLLASANATRTGATGNGTGSLHSGGTSSPMVVRPADDFSSAWQVVSRKGGRPGTKSRVKHGPGPGTGMSAPSTSQGAVTAVATAKRKKKNKAQRKRERLIRESLKTAIVNAPPGPNAPAKGTGPGEQVGAVREPRLGTQISGKPGAGPSSTSVNRAKGSQKKALRPGGLARATEKRARLDDSTSPRGEHKKRRLEGACRSGVQYSEAVSSDLNIAVTDECSTGITKDLAKEILCDINKRVLTEALNMALGGGIGGRPGFRGKPTYVDGHLMLQAMDAFTVDWVRRGISELATPSNVKLVVKRQSEVPGRIRCGIFIPDDTEFWRSESDMGRVLHYQNGWAGVSRWLLTGSEKQPKGWFLTLSVPEDCVAAILAKGRCLCFGAGTVYLKFKGPQGRFYDEPPAHNTRDPPATAESTSAQDKPGSAEPVMQSDCEDALLASPSQPDQGTSGGDQVGNEPTVASPPEVVQLPSDGDAVDDQSIEPPSESEDLSGRMEAGLSLEGDEGLHDDGVPFVDP